ncbi:tyramine beta-hydroxylase isoform X1 [Malaya genurostris]|uniref:tyramine beta-hydroxylase isoform X1 n=1 Tax=Malaya genurostris TaxID=325434 RepID=UPI0026F3CA41|nr:tyramine beta-hydroxylase isoform X1 [Malaya genurostris]XP_058445070.1 tyramine beta-hydroxylase isoform X1 [Malaya genurostris]
MEFRTAYRWTIFAIVAVLCALYVDVSQATGSGIDQYDYPVLKREADAAAWEEEIAEFKREAQKDISANQIHTLNLDRQKLKLTWMMDWYRKEVLFHVQNTFLHGRYKFFAIGFSPRGELKRTDLCVFSSQGDGMYHQVLDTYTSRDFSRIYADTTQDCSVMRIDEKSIAFRRKFDTCDPQDVAIHGGTMYVVWMRGRKELDFSANWTLLPKISKSDQGVLPVQILRADAIEVPEEKSLVKKLDIRLDQAIIPAVETTYWCKVQRLEPWLAQKKHHLVQFEPIITNEHVVHHMEVFQCVADSKHEIPEYEGSCADMPPEATICNKVMALWAMGASAFTYPHEAGLPVGGKEFNPYVRLEVHFNNPDVKTGIKDSSGMRISVVSKLRKHDAAIMELGLEYTDKMAIPPGQVAFPLTGYCIAECTKVALPSDGITIFGSQLHTHLRGVRILTRHFRNGVELREVNRDDFYSHHYQEIRQLRYRPKILPGDALMTTCYYDTRGYEAATLGGFSISDEMCVNYISYYPATKLELCKSAISEKSLYNYFKYMREVEQQNTVRPGEGRSDNYHNIQWTKARADQLLEYYLEEPLSMQCNRSDGFRFDGFNWEGAPVTEFSPPRRTLKEHCKIPSELHWFKPLEVGKCDAFGDCIYADEKIKE